MHSYQCANWGYLCKYSFPFMPFPCVNPLQANMSQANCKATNGASTGFFSGSFFGRKKKKKPEKLESLNLYANVSHASLTVATGAP